MPVIDPIFFQIPPVFDFCTPAGGFCKDVFAFSTPAEAFCALVFPFCKGADDFCTLVFVFRGGNIAFCAPAGGFCGSIFPFAGGGTLARAILFVVYTAFAGVPAVINISLNQHPSDNPVMVHKRKHRFANVPSPPEMISER